MRTSIYIDGFNLYYLAVRGTRYKWLDLKAVCQKLLPPVCKIEVIKYFTARVSGKFDPDQPIRQSTYIRALESYIPELEVYSRELQKHANFVKQIRKGVLSSSQLPDPVPGENPGESYSKPAGW